MNEVNAYIKKMILNYPCIMPSRFHVLKQMFLTNGNGMEWVDGRLVSIFSENDLLGTKMNNDDLEERIAKNKIELEDCHEFALSFHMKYKLRYEREMMERKHIEDNIDVYASEHVVEHPAEYSAEWLKHIDPDWTALSISNPYSNRFPEFMLPEWAEAAEEIVRIARQSLYVDIGMHYDNFDETKADQNKLLKYKKFCEILERLDAFTGWKEKEAEKLAFFKSLKDD